MVLPLCSVSMFTTHAQTLLLLAPLFTGSNQGVVYNGGEDSAVQYHQNHTIQSKEFAMQTADSRLSSKVTHLT
jgi:hypothetical protein